MTLQQIRDIAIIVACVAVIVICGYIVNGLKISVWVENSRVTIDGNIGVKGSVDTSVESKNSCVDGREFYE